MLFKSRGNIAYNTSDLPPDYAWYVKVKHQDTEKEYKGEVWVWTNCELFFRIVYYSSTEVIQVDEYIFISVPAYHVLLVTGAASVISSSVR